MALSQVLAAGGVSMGDKDFIKPLLEAHGQVHFGKVPTRCLPSQPAPMHGPAGELLLPQVKMKPGKPLTFATLDVGAPSRRLLSFGLPGNPVSAIVTFSLAVLPSLRKLAGWQVRSRSMAASARAALAAGQARQLSGVLSLASVDQPKAASPCRSPGCGGCTHARAAR